VTTPEGLGVHQVAQMVPHTLRIQRRNRQRTLALQTVVLEIPVDLGLGTVVFRPRIGPEEVEEVQVVGVLLGTPMEMLAREALASPSPSQELQCVMRLAEVAETSSQLLVRQVQVETVAGQPLVVQGPKAMRWQGQEPQTQVQAAEALDLMTARETALLVQEVRESSSFVTHSPMSLLATLSQLLSISLR
jgi:hypothetical protein